MSLNDTPSSVRINIGFFGRRNAGKSSLVNAITGQEVSLVSDIKGTTTDPVQKAMELLPLGPVMIIDTPGFDDEGSLGKKRVQRTKFILNKTDIAVLVVDSNEGMQICDRELLSLFEEKKIPYIIVYNKADLCARQVKASNEIAVCALNGQGIHNLKEMIASLSPSNTEKYLLADLIKARDYIVLVVPIDSSAPKGRLILPQQQTIREILDSNAVSIIVKEDELAETLSNLGKTPAMVITDSQVFDKVASITPPHIPLTSFSILMARFKGFLDFAVEGVSVLDHLRDGDRILMAEGCTHHRQCGDIGTVKIPAWLKDYTNKELIIESCSGNHFPEDLSSYSLIIHCGGCMLNEREVIFRAKCAKDQGVPMTNYGIAIAHMKGILRRSIELFPDLIEKLDK